MTELAWLRCSKNIHTTRKILHRVIANLNAGTGNSKSRRRSWATANLDAGIAKTFSF